MEPPQRQLSSVHNPATCTRKGLCPVTKPGNHKQDSPLESHFLYFEQHGTGPRRVVFVMGLNSSCNAWSPQVEHFGRLPQYSILVFDNRGVGNSDTPMGPYSTSDMAIDVIALLDFVGWTDEQSLHLVGISLGGMIAQELSYRIPERFISQTLVSTTAGGFPLYNIPPWTGLKTLLRTSVILEPKQRAPYAVEIFFNASWLDAKAENDRDDRTNREVQIASYTERAAITRSQTQLGVISQMWAAFTHHMQPERLGYISKMIPKTLILSGDQDDLIRPSNSEYLKRHMPEAEYLKWKDTGHVLSGQRVERFNVQLEGVFLEGEARL